MFNHLYVYQSKEISERNVSTELIKKIYSIIHKDELDPYLDNSTNLVGKINIGYTYQYYLDKIYEKFPDLEINADGTYVYFEDKNVETLLINNFCNEFDGVMVDTKFDPTNGFYKNGRHIFQGNIQIETFDELNQLINAKKIGNSDFKNCTNLRSINLSNVNYIGEQAFNGCNKLEIALYAPNLNTISISSFLNSGITSITSLGNITTIPESCFNSCKKLITIEEGAFENITNIDKNAFYECTYLESISTMPSLLVIGSSVFQQCSSLSSFTLSNTISSIGSQAFYQCNACVINDFNLPNLNNLGSMSFRGTQLKKISNIGNITTIPENCFYDCKQLTIIDNDALDNVTSIGKGAFFNCTSLTSVGTLSNLTKISDYGFQNCTSLTSFDLNSGITSIGYQAFYLDNLYVINDLNLPNLTSLGASAFRGTKLKKISNIGNITTIPENCFWECKQLTTIDNDALDNVTSIDKYAFCYCSSLTSVGILSNLKTIGEYAFQNCSSLTSIDLNSSITSIGRQAFQLNTLLVINDLNLPNLTSLGSRAFQETIIKKITSLGSITTIPESCFEKCTQLNVIDDNALSNVTRIEKDAFYNCPITSLGNITNLEYLGGQSLYGTQISYIDLSHVKTVGGNVFSQIQHLDCKLTDAGAVDLTNVEFIDGWALDNVKYFNSDYIDLGTHLTRIRHQAFTGCHANIIVRCTEVPDVSTGWRNLQPSDGYYTYVPEALIEEYKTKCSSYAWAFKTIENDLPAQYR